MITFVETFVRLTKGLDENVEIRLIYCITLHGCKTHLLSHIAKLFPKEIQFK